MQCYNHPEAEAMGICTRCGRAVCDECGVEVQGRLECRSCLAAGSVLVPRRNHDPNTAFLIELVGGFFGLLGLGYFYVGRTNDGIVRLLLWILYDVIAAITISLLLAVIVGVVCLPIQLAVQIAVPLWSATTLKNQLLTGPYDAAVGTRG